MKKMYGSETEKAIENFAVSDYKLNNKFIQAFGLVKYACAQINGELGFLKKEISDAICSACREIIDGKHHDQIRVDALQGGAGTSTNMNFNEVIATLANQKLGSDLVTPLNHVNLHQSTNDVYPSALKVAVLLLLKDVEKQLSDLQAELQNKEFEFKDILKLGRTQLQDALPMTLGMTFGAFSEAIARDRWRIFKSRERIKVINLGGTAIGTGLNAPREYIFKVAERLRQLTGLSISRSENMVDTTQNLDQFVEISGMLKGCAVNIQKICNDLRLMSSGPDSGLGEIILPERQKGSTIMPGKINPVIPEMMIQISYKIMANDFLITQTAAQGTLELNHLIPLLGFSILESLSLLNRSLPKFTNFCIKGIKPNRTRCKINVEKSSALATILVGQLGYEKVEKIVQKSRMQNKSIKEICLQEKLFTHAELDELLAPSSMYKLGFSKD